MELNNFNKFANKKLPRFSLQNETAKSPNNFYSPSFENKNDEADFSIANSKKNKEKQGLKAKFIDKFKSFTKQFRIDKISKHFAYKQPDKNKKSKKLYQSDIAVKKENILSFGAYLKNLHNAAAPKENEPAQIISDDVVNNLRKSLDNIPSKEDERMSFIINFLKTDLYTGEENSMYSNGYMHKTLKSEAKKLTKYKDENLKIVLEHVLKMSELLNLNHIYFNDLGKNISVYKNIKKRNMYSIIEQRKNVVSDYKTEQPLNLCLLGSLPNNEYRKVYNLIQKVGINDSEFDLNALMKFGVYGIQDTIDYMLDKDLFNPENVQSFNYGSGSDTKQRILSFFMTVPKNIVEKMYTRGLLGIIPERNACIRGHESIELASGLSDEEWERVKKRNLLGIKTNSGKYPNSTEICNLAKAPEDIFSKIKSRNIMEKVGHKTWAILIYAQLDDVMWRRISDRKIDIENYNFDSKDDLYKFLSISDEDWNNVIKRKLNSTFNDNYFIYDIESIFRLCKLTDEEYENAQKRGLIKEEYYGKLKSFSEEAELLAKCPDDKYSLYFARKIHSFSADISTKKDMLNMTDEQYEKYIKDIFPIAEKYANLKYIYNTSEYEIPEYYKLVYLNENEYELAKQFLDVKYLGFEQFSIDDIYKIIKLEPEKIERLKKLLSSKIYLNKVPKHYHAQTLMKLTELNIDEFDKAIESVKYLSSYQFEKYIEDGSIVAIINSKVFEENKDILFQINDSKMMIDTKNELVNIILGVSKKDYSKMNLKQKIKQNSILQEAQLSGIFKKEETGFLNIDKEMAKLQNSIQKIISTTNVSKESYEKMMKDFFANNNPELDNLLSTTDFTIYSKSGLPLKYSRVNFMDNLNSLLQNLDNDLQTKIFEKLEITPIKNNEKITGYDGVINLNKLSNEGTEGEVLKLANKFIKNNSVITGDKQLDNALNSLIQGMPEFINIIGKKQHETHDFSLDIHILSVLKDSIANPQYKNLRNEDKFCLKLAVVLHDIAKIENLKDDKHPEVSALYARDIMNKPCVKIADNIKDRVYELIKNHHWLALYNNKIKSAEEIAVMFRRKGDLKIAQIMAEADLKNIKADGSYYSKYSDALNNVSQAPIEDALKKINSSGQIFLVNKIVDSSKLPKTEYNGQVYKIIDFTKLPKDFDLSKYGFESGTTVDNFRLFFHTIKERELKNKLEAIVHLSDASNQGYLCASYVSIDNHPTFLDNKFGVSIYSENINIANAINYNQSSGTGKNFYDFTKIVSDKDINHSYRNLISNSIKKSLKLSDSEYSELYSKIQNYKFISQLDNTDTITVRNKKFSGEEIKKAIIFADDLMLLHLKNAVSIYNEANLYNPKTNAVVAKVNSIEEIPQILFDYAQKYNLPIYIIGN